MFMSPLAGLGVRPVAVAINISLLGSDAVSIQLNVELFAEGRSSDLPRKPSRFAEPELINYFSSSVILCIFPLNLKGIS
jgi:hypothetical protein